MGLSINTNIESTNAYRNLSNTQNLLAKNLEKLSSGYRINRAADDAAGLAISEGLRSQIGGLKVASRNAQDGISVVQTAEGALTEVHSILQRLRDLSVQGANDSNNTAARANITTEATQLTAELTRIGESTNFNGKNLLDGTATLNFQIGADGAASSALEVDLSSIDVTGLEASIAFSVASHSDAQTTLGNIDTAIESISTQRSTLGAYQNRLEHTIKSVNVAVENLTASESRIRDTDIAQEMTNFTKNQVLSQAGMAMLAQANSSPQSVLSLLR